MPFPIYMPFYPGHQPNMIFSREADIDDYNAYLALADETTSAAVFDTEVPADGPVLDAGCGGGRWLVRLHERGRCSRPGTVPPCRCFVRRYLRARDGGWI